MIASDDSSWTTSVDRLVRLFHAALAALIPVVEEARVPWREGEAYDSWDAIASVLYVELVRAPLAWGLNAVDDLELAGYDLALESWRDTSFVAVRHASLPPGATAVFLRFGTRQEPLDTVVVAVLDPAFAPEGGEEALPFEDVTFVLQRREGDRHRTVANLTVPE